MAVLPILKWPDPCLSEICEPVEAGDDIEELVLDMFATMYAAPGRGLAAPQVGVTKRLFVTDTTWKEGARSPIAFINPRVVSESPELVASEEGCLSIPGITIEVPRPSWVALEWTSVNGDAASRKFEGFDAACVLHELDHLDGLVTFDLLDDETRAEAEAAYLANPL